MRLRSLVSAIIPIIMFIIITGCSEDAPTSPPSGGGNTSQAPLAKFSDLQVKVFNSCAVANCHSSGSKQGNLDLSNGQAYSNLVGVQSVLFPQYKRVEPGNGGNSLLIKILKGEVSPRMPLNRTALTNDVIDSIEVWINRGALNN